MLVNDFCRFGLSRVEQKHFPAALADCLDAVLHIGSRHQASVGSGWIGAKNQHELGAVDIRNRDSQPISKHQTGGQMVRQLIDRGGRKLIFCSQRFLQERLKQHRPKVVNSRVTKIQCDGIVAVILSNLRQLSLGQIESFFP